MAKRGARGPAQKACTACKKRKTACKRDSGSARAACEGCLKRGLECSYLAESSIEPTPRRASKSIYLPSSSIALSSIETRLADNDMSETFGLELLTLYGDASSSCSDPIYPPPVLDYSALRSRYEAAGRRLYELSPSDQLTCRILFASVSRLRASSSAAASESKLVRQLTSNAASHADSMGIWRRACGENAIALLLLYQLAAAGEIASEEAKPYMAALVGQLRTMYRSQPKLLMGESGAGASALVWSVFAFHVFSAVERREPLDITNREFLLFLGGHGKVSSRELSDRDFLQFLGGATGGLPPVQVVLDALQTDPWSLTNWELLWIAHYSTIAGRVSSILSVMRDRELGAEEAVELGEIWARVEELVDYLHGMIMAADGVEAEPFALVIFHVYAELTYGAIVFAALAVLLALDESTVAPSASATATTHLQHYRPHFSDLASRYLRRVRGSTTCFLAVFTGSAWSVSRLVAFAQLVKATSAWDVELYPRGPADKLESLNYLSTALASVGRAYPNKDLQAVLEAVSAEQRALALLLNVPLPSPTSLSSSLASTPASLSSTPSTSTSPSLSQLSSWTFKNDSRADEPTLFRVIPKRGPGAEPALAADPAQQEVPVVLLPPGPEKANERPYVTRSEPFSSVGANEPFSSVGASLPIPPAELAQLFAFAEAAPASAFPAPDSTASLFPPPLHRSHGAGTDIDPSTYRLFSPPLSTYTDPSRPSSSSFSPVSALSTSHLASVDYSYAPTADLPPPPPPPPQPVQDTAFLETFLAQLVDEVEPIVGQA
ncbi:hypothetical protein JCM8097_001345 [Rhodosporidiobolus ruineniae]